MDGCDDWGDRRESNPRGPEPQSGATIQQLPRPQSPRQESNLRPPGSKPGALPLSYEGGWYFPWESNPQALRQQGLSLQRFPVSPGKHGAHDGIRTHISFLDKEVLSQLSYGGVCGDYHIKRTFSGATIYAKESMDSDALHALETSPASVSVRCEADLCAGTFAGSVPEPACTVTQLCGWEPEKQESRSPVQWEAASELEVRTMFECCLGDNHLRSRCGLMRQARERAQDEPLGIIDADKLHCLGIAARFVHDRSRTDTRGSRQVLRSVVPSVESSVNRFYQIVSMMPCRYGMN